MNWPLTDTLCVETAILVQSSCDNVWQPTNLSTLHLWLWRTSRWTTVDIVIQCPLVVATITEADFCFFCLWIITACQYRGRYIPATRHFAVTLSTSRYVFSIPRQLSYYYVYVVLLVGLSCDVTRSHMQVTAYNIAAVDCLDRLVSLSSVTWNPYYINSFCGILMYIKSIN